MPKPWCQVFPEIYLWLSSPFWLVWGCCYTNFKPLNGNGQTLHDPTSKPRSRLSTYSKIQSVNLSKLPRKFAAGWHSSEQTPPAGFSASQDALGCRPKSLSPREAHPRKKPKRKAGGNSGGE